MRKLKIASSILFQMITQLYSCLCCEPRPQFPDPYSFHFGPDALEINRGVFQGNQIKTTKYNILNFIPKSILTQYQRLANFYFLMVATIATIPEVTPLNPALIWTPLTLVLCISIIKELYEDYTRYKTDKMVNEEKQTTVVRDGRLQKIKWKDVVVGDICRIQEEELFPADILLISSSDHDGVAFIETATLDGEQTSKIRYAFHELNLKFRDHNIHQLSGTFQGSIPSPTLNQFQGTLKVGKNHLAINDSGQLLFRGARLKRTKWICGVVVYTGQCSKIMMNGQSFVTKLSMVECKLNYLLILMLVVQLLVCLTMSIVSTTKQIEMKGTQSYIIWRKFNKGKLLVMNFLLFFIEYSSLIPVSLIVSIEIAKAVQSYFIDFDQLMYSDWRKRKAYARIAALNQELGQIEYIFCDKTGTLTKNQLQFHTAVIGNQFYEVKHDSQTNKYQNHKLQTEIASMQRNTEFLTEELVMATEDSRLNIGDYARLVEEYLMSLLVCNNISTVDDETKGIVYESESPDELALINMAKDFGFKFLKRDKTSILVEISKSVHRIEVVTCFPFSSDRKRMSVIVKWRDSYILYIKGADNVILQRAIESPFHLTKSIDQLCRSGLRSLLVGTRVIEDELMETFLSSMNQAKIEQRQYVLQTFAKEFQKEITVLGATGLLDELQDEVPQTLKDLQRADIRVWMLTGDKLETAMEIGKACNLIGRQYEVIVMKKGVNSIKNSLQQCAIRVYQLEKKYALVIEGSVLTQIFNNEQYQKDFAHLSVHFASVICCRMLPVQKSQAVRMIKTHLGKICLSIGDGGNDVSMIKEANIGIGLYGEEGMSAVQASDYALPEFKMLWRLLFVHGRWNYMRISQMILYFAYKSIIFTVPRFLFSFMNAYSGQPIYDDFYIALYNVCFTALPLLIRALFEQDVNYVYKVENQNQVKQESVEEMRGQAKHLPKGFKINEGMRKLFPKIYFVGQKNQIFNIRECLLWILQAILMAVCLFFIIETVLSCTSILPDGYNGNLQLVGITIYTTIIMLDTLKLSMQVRHWTKLLFFCILFLSIIPYLSFIWVLNYRFKRPVFGVLEVFFTSVRTYLAILVISMILVAINGVLIYLRFHSDQILRKMSIAIQKDEEIISYLSHRQHLTHLTTKQEVRQSDDCIKPRTNKVICDHQEIKDC